MQTKKVVAKKRIRKDDVTENFSDSYKKNFDCSSIELKKMYPTTDNHRAFYYLSQYDSTNMIFLDAPAGAAKSYLAVYTALELLKHRKVDQIIYVRTVVESASRSMGFLKGSEEDKLEPYMQVMMQKGLEIVDKQTLTSLIEQEYIKAIPVNFARGLTFNNSVVIFDEAQNATRSEITTILTRFGRGTKYLILGDPKQSDISNSGFSVVRDLFNTEFSRKNDIHCVKFDASDIVRSPILKHITQVLGV